MAGLVAPGSYPIRDPKDKAVKHGRITNPVRYPEIGGMTGPGKWGDKANPFAVEKPTGVRTARAADRSSD